MPGELTIVLVGPGGVARPVRRFIHDAVPERTPELQRVIRNFPRVVDQVLRRIPGMPLVSLEPGELQELIRPPYRLVVVDISRRVLAAVQRDYPSSQCIQLDIAREPLGVSADVIVAYSVLTRTSDGQAAMNHVTAALKPGGLLLVDDRSARRWLPPAPAFTTVDEQIYRKADATATAGGSVR